MRRTGTGPNTTKLRPCGALVKAQQERLPRAAHAASGSANRNPESFLVKTREVSGGSSGPCAKAHVFAARPPQIPHGTFYRGVRAPSFSQETWCRVAPCKGSGSQGRSPREDAVTAVHSGGYFRSTRRLEPGACGARARSGARHSGRGGLHASRCRIPGGKCGHSRRS